MQKTIIFTFILFSCFFHTNINAQIPKAFDVVIDEILADPTPLVGLPDAEFIEIKNISGGDINLDGWRLSGLSTVSKPCLLKQVHLM